LFAVHNRLPINVHQSVIAEAAADVANKLVTRNSATSEGPRDAAC